MLCVSDKMSADLLIFIFCVVVLGSIIKVQTNKD